MSAPTGVGGDLRDELALGQSHSDRLSREETAFSRHRGA